MLHRRMWWMVGFLLVLGAPVRAQYLSSSNTARITLMQSALGTPGAPIVAATAPDGTNTHWGYKIVQTTASGATLPSTETVDTGGSATLSASKYELVTIAVVTGAILYQVWRTTAGGTPATTGLVAVLQAPPAGVPTLVLQDTGLVSTSALANISASNTSGIAVGDHTIYLTAAGIAPTFDAAPVNTPALSGTVSLTNGSNAVAGVATTFTLLVDGQYLAIGTLAVMVSSVGSDTSLTLAQAWGGSAVNGSSVPAQSAAVGSGAITAWTEAGDPATPFTVGTDPTIAQSSALPQGSSYQYVGPSVNQVHVNVGMAQTFHLNLAWHPTG